ncbi:hypothetical protein MAPG_03945 [Magnaporthiopsis poae ATCC 64411]|uniref:Uncharacterized protein n=1 Tax=Magnaporthiopsis poae (strain ATCC 64411 / 73-15) TaxID=644358 RepID=A0A0C4DVE1_MAGP6|nr:hypothetical protein MAPG_03945 [Magnaporthiopsis poae ATCC 64411]
MTSEGLLHDTISPFGFTSFHHLRPSPSRSGGSAKAFSPNIRSRKAAATTMPMNPTTNNDKQHNERKQQQPLASGTAHQQEKEPPSDRQTFPGRNTRNRLRDARDRDHHQPRRETQDPAASVMHHTPTPHQPRPPVCDMAPTAHDEEEERWREREKTWIAGRDGRNPELEWEITDRPSEPRSNTNSQGVGRAEAQMETEEKKKNTPRKWTDNPATCSKQRGGDDRFTGGRMWVEPDHSPPNSVVQAKHKHKRKEEKKTSPERNRRYNSTSKRKKKSIKYFLTRTGTWTWCTK